MNNSKAIILIAIETFLLLALFTLIPQEVLAGVGNPTESLSNLTVANSFPEIHNISINNNNPIALTPNATTQVICAAIILDWNGDTDIQNATAKFYEESTPESDPDDNNNHYTNSSCTVDKAFGVFNTIVDDEYMALANCTFQIDYYANPGNWNCTIQANDSVNNIGIDMKQETVSELLALGLPDLIHYGIVNATSVSDEREINVTNYGNIKVNISLEGYGFTPSDGNAMNCTWGSSKNISVDLEKFNLTASAPGQLDLAQFQANYTNLTSTSVTRQFNLTSRISDSSDDTKKPTYWRIYVPQGVAGTCTGNIVFGATKAPEI